MKVLTVLNPFEGEHVIGLSPVPAAEITDWNRRLNLFSGRALTFQASPSIKTKLPSPSPPALVSPPPEKMYSSRLANP